MHSLTCAIFKEDLNVFLLLTAVEYPFEKIYFDDVMRINTIEKAMLNSGIINYGFNFSFIHTIKIHTQDTTHFRYTLLLIFMPLV